MFAETCGKRVCLAYAEDRLTAARILAPDDKRVQEGLAELQSLRR